MSRPQPDLQAQLLRAYEQALTKILAEAKRGLERAWWLPDVQKPLLTIERLADMTLRGKSAYRPRGTASKKPSKRSGETNGKSKR